MATILSKDVDKAFESVSPEVQAVLNLVRKDGRKALKTRDVTKDNVAEAFEVLLSLVEGRSNSDNMTPRDDDFEDAKENVEENNKQQGNETSQVLDCNKEKMICPLHRLGRCPMKNGECPKLHPRICKYFGKYGSAQHDERGCRKKTSECKFLHPPLCKKNMDGICSGKKEGCKKLHIRNDKKKGSKTALDVKKSTEKSKGTEKNPKKLASLETPAHRSPFLETTGLIRELEEWKTNLMQDIKLLLGRHHQQQPQVISPWLPIPARAF